MDCYADQPAFTCNDIAQNVLSFSSINPPNLTQNSPAMILSNTKHSSPTITTSDYDSNNEEHTEKITSNSDMVFFDLCVMTPKAWKNTDLTNDDRDTILAKGAMYVQFDIGAGTSICSPEFVKRHGFRQYLRQQPTQMHGINGLKVKVTHYIHVLIYIQGIDIDGQPASRTFNTQALITPNSHMDFILGSNVMLDHNIVVIPDERRATFFRGEYKLEVNWMPWDIVQRAKKALAYQNSINSYSAPSAITSLSKITSSPSISYSPTCVKSLAQNLTSDGKDSSLHSQPSAPTATSLDYDSDDDDDCAEIITSKEGFVFFNLSILRPEVWNNSDLTNDERETILETCAMYVQVDGGSVSSVCSPLFAKRTGFRLYRLHEPISMAGFDGIDLEATHYIEVLIYIEGYDMSGQSANRLFRTQAIVTPSCHAEFLLGSNVMVDHNIVVLPDERKVTIFRRPDKIEVEWISWDIVSKSKNKKSQQLNR